MAVQTRTRDLTMHQRLRDGDLSKIVTSSRRLSLSFKQSPLEPTETVTSLFHQQVKLHPLDPALEVENEGITTYSTLDWQSSVIANYIPANTVIAVCLDRSTNLLVSVLGILKAGSAYVVLDPTVPVERNNFIVQDVNAAAVLTSSAYASQFSNAVIVDTLLRRSPTTSRLARPATIDPSSPAYIIYTSGSSGKPKGVVISHRAATRGIMHFSLNDKMRWLFFYNPIFSAAQRTMLATLCKGGVLCITSKENMTVSLMDVIQRMNIEAIGLTPSILSTITANQLPSCLKQITCVGEPVSQGLADSFASKVEFRVSYGLSECAQLNFNRRLAPGDNPAMVGKPRDTTDAIVLRQDTNEIASPGETGELCLIGPQLADGYLNRPEETERAFVTNPFGPGKMFRTGDLARIIGNSFEVLGRADNQVKINGQRLEPEEVSSVLTRHPAVANAYVIAATVKGIKCLTAAVVLYPEYEWSKITAELKDVAQSMLPSYMIPAYWIQYQDLPLNANGKVDRMAIRERVEAASMNELLLRSGEHKEIDDPVGKIIQRVWADILSLDISSIGGSDAFFDLGGSSLQAIQMLNELRKVDIHLTLESMFRRESLSDLCEHAVIKESTEMVAPFSLIEDHELLESIRAQPGVVDAFPATDFQESLVGITLQGSADYTYQRVWDIYNLDQVRLRLALHIAYLRSQNLRTTFVSGDTGLIQVVRADMKFPLETLDMSLEQYRQEDLKRGFTLGESFFRAAILQGSILVVTMHHALFDFWSHSFLYDDVAMYYNGLQPGPRPGFQGFVAEMRRMDWKPSEMFWREGLETAAQSQLNFAPTPRATNVSRSLSLNLSQVASSHNVTVGSIIYTAWAMVLSQQLGSSDIVFAAPFSGRDTPLVDIDRLDGPTLTVAPLRFVFGPQQSLSDLIQMGHVVAMEALKHSQYGLRKILKASSQRASLFDTMVNILPVRSKPENGIFKLYGEKPTWKTEYTTLEIEQGADGVLARLSSSMEADRAGFILDQFIMAIQMMLHEPLRPASTLNLITETESQMLAQSIDMPTELPATMLSRFDEMVERFPHRAALQWQNIESISYADFDAKANQLARHLVSMGVKKGDFVCLMLEKSPMMIVAIFGVLKAGAAYVPLSSENPIERNRFIVEEVAAKLILSETGIEQTSQLHNSVVLLDKVDFASLEKSALGNTIDSQDVAYVIYTSGSTGKPKGVLIPHGAGAAAVESMVQYEGRKRGFWRALQFSNYIFDASILEIFNTLTSGGTLCIAPNDRLLSSLAEVINEMTVTHAFFTPTVARLVTPKDVPTLRSLTIGGEALTEDIMDIWGNDCVIFQAYGPSETAIAVTMRDMEFDRRANNLGRPFPTVQAFILERDGTNLVPYGAVGELCVAGPQLGLGYVNRPETTAAAFIKTDLAGNSMLYRTGDLARWLPGGEIQYLGRKDNQVKVNGHRIELGEIERAMIAAGGLTDCVAVVAKIEGKPQIAAYPIFDQHGEAGIQAPDAYVDRVTELRNKLTGLAHYMYPKIVLPMHSLPLMPSGKVNRKMLVAWVEKMEIAQICNYYFDFFGGAGTMVAAETGAEKFMEEAFMAVLKVNKDVLGKTANFLALGGDSIAAISLTSYARKQGYNLTVNTILKYPLLKDMAKQIGIPDDVESDSSTIVEFEPPQFIYNEIDKIGLPTDEVDYIYPCPPGQAEFLSQGSTKSKGWVLMTVRPFPSSHNLEKWVDAVEQLTETNEILRTTFTKKNGMWYGVVLKCANIVLDLVDVPTEEKKRAYIKSIYESNFTFGKPFIRYAAIRSPSGQVDIVTKMDHALYDGTLLRIFASHFKDIQHIGHVTEISPFKDFALHIAGLSKEKMRALEFFTTKRKPLGFQFPNIPSPSATKTVFVPDSIDVDGFATEAGITIPILFQAAFQAWLSRATGRQTVSMDYLYTGRNVPLLNPQDINGCTANFVPLQAEVTGTVGQYLEATQAEFWTTTDHGVVGLDEIFAAAKLNREKYANRSLFLFQPFDPVPPKAKEAFPTGEGEDMRWVFMAGSEVMMMQPYGLVVEVGKMMSGHKIKVTYDPRAFNDEGAKKCGSGIWDIVKAMMDVGLAGDVEDCL
ncbi:nonribosomal peptide synthase side [Mariannaea sp. PMI_226]|nr:nonribosomal peptide synthase side [Mariannaea sp. PMI_226]